MPQPDDEVIQSSPRELQQRFPPLPIHSEESSGTTRLLLICHAESVHHRYGGLQHEDSGLTAQGWEQTTAVADWLQTYEQIDKLISTSQLSSRLTAQRIGQKYGLNATVDSRLPVTVEESWSGSPPDGSGEQNGFASFCHEIVSAVREILEENWGHSVALVAGAPLISTLLRYFFGSQQIGIELSPTAISEVSYENQSWRLRYCNRLEHLGRIALAPAVADERPPEDESLLDELRTTRLVYNRLAATYTGVDLVGHTGELTVPATELIQFAGFEPDRRILEVGSGSGHLALELAKAGAREVVGVDISPAMLERAEYLRLSQDHNEMSHRVSFRLAAAHRLPFQAARFDAAIARLLLHHMNKPQRVLTEIARVLKPGSVLVLAELVGSDDPVKRATQNAIESRRNPSHASIPTAAGLRDRLTAAGLSIEKEKQVSIERRAGEWLSDLSLDESTQAAVLEMMEASIETDAADMQVRRTEDDLVFTQHLLLLRARTAPASQE